MPYPIDFKTLATLFDFEHTLHLTYKEITGGDPISARKRLMQLAGAAIAGYTNIDLSLGDLQESIQEFMEQANELGLNNDKDLIKGSVLSVFFPGSISN